jgi:hypothetical protein
VGIRVDIVELVDRRLPLIALGAVLIAHSLSYGFVTDDAYISFVYSRNLAETGSLVFNPGDPVEGYTNFLWTLVLGGLMTVGLPPEITSLVLGTACGFAVMVVASRLVERLIGERSGWDLVAPALLALSAGFACWSSGGLETQMFTLWIALAVDAVVASELEPRRIRRVGAFLALAAMTRPEGLMVAGVIAVHRFALNVARDRRWWPSGHELACIGAFLVLWAPWFAWRWWYYGYPFPNTFYVKAAGPAAPDYHARMFRSGLYYVWQWAQQTRIVYAAPLIAIGLVARRWRSPRFAFGSLAALLACVYLVYTVRVGGDFMGLHRFVMPLFFVGAVAVTLGLATVVRAIRHDRRRAVVGAVFAVGMLAAFAADQRALTRRSLSRLTADHGIDTPGYLRMYARDRAIIGRHLRHCLRPDDFSIFGGVGAKPYFARARGIDVFGLVSSRIAHEVPRTNPRPGHNKWGGNELLAEYHPTFVFSCYSLHRDPARPRWNCDPSWWIQRGYEPVTLHIPGLRERGEHYTFLVKKDRRFACPGRVE